MSSVVVIVGRIAIAMGIGWVIFKWFEWRSLYAPARKIPRTPADAGLAFEEFEFVAEDDQRLCAWWVPHPEAALTLLVCHGNSGNMGYYVEWLADLHRMKVNIMIFDYRGYGKSAGFPTEKGLYRDARAAYEWIRAAQYGNADRPPVVAYGLSLGAAVAAQLALDRALAGVILQNPFTSIRDMATFRHGEHGFGRLVPRRYDTLSKIGDIRTPLLVAAGRYDEVGPLEMGRALFERAGSPSKQFIELSGGHYSSGWRSDPAYWERLRTFLCTC